jgi:hypothetical protein
MTLYGNSGFVTLTHAKSIEALAEASVWNVVMEDEGVSTRVKLHSGLRDVDALQFA